MYIHFDHYIPGPRLWVIVLPSVNFNKDESQLCLMTTTELREICLLRQWLTHPVVIVE